MNQIAVIGAGAAALGALLGLARRPERPRVTLIAPSLRVHPPPSPPPDGVAAVRAFYDTQYREVLKRQGLRFPPVKSHFAEPLDRYSVGGKFRFPRSLAFGGLTNYWGATMLPFAGDDWLDWPLGADQMAPWYRLVAEAVGISGRADALTEVFGAEYSNRPPIRLLRGLARLEEAVNGAPADGVFDIRAGINRVSLETRPGRADACVECGECMAGCFRGSVFSAAPSIDSLLASLGGTHVPATAWRFRPGGVVEIDRENGARERLTGFDRILLCAGAVDSAGIIMRSLDLPRGPVLVDNAVYQFPVLNLGEGEPAAGRDRYISLSSLILACRPRRPGPLSAQIQIYPNFDYLWRCAVPGWVWPAVRPFSGLMRDRLLWARLYAHSRHCYHYALHLDDGGRLGFEEIRAPDRSAVTEALESARRVLRRRGFRVPGIKPIVSKTSSHLAGPFSFGSDPVRPGPDGAVASGVHLCDSSLFPHSPATSPTFTIIANAARIAAEIP